MIDYLCRIMSSQAASKFAIQVLETITVNVALLMSAVYSFKGERKSILTEASTSHHRHGLCGKNVAFM